MFSFLNFSFDSPTRDARESSSKANKYAPDNRGRNTSFNWRSDSNTTSPTSSSAGTPKRIPLLCTPPPMKPPREAPSARPAMACPPRGPKGHHGGVRKRRSSIFFKIPDIDKVRKGGGRTSHSSSSSKAKDKDAPAAPTAAEKEKEKDQQQQQQQQQQQPAKLSRPSSRRRSRRASVAPSGGSPIRTRALRSPFGTGTEDTLKLKLGCEDLLPAGSAAAAAAAAASAAVAAEGFCSEDPREDGRVGHIDSPHEEVWGGQEQQQLAALAEDRSVVLISPKTPPPRSSPRALSAGHRRESCRDGGISRAPKVLSAARLLEDAQDVAGIRADAGLRANYQGVCWIASNWCVGGTKGVLSGKRYLVLCDNIIWAELREVDRRSSVGEHEQAGFLPIISLAGATVQHCEVASSNNGWIIEVVNPATDVTLWLDPENPASLLRWGSVMCQALAKTIEDSAEERCME